MRSAICSVVNVDNCIASSCFQAKVHQYASHYLHNSTKRCLLSIWPFYTTSAVWISDWFSFMTYLVGFPDDNFTLTEVFPTLTEAFSTLIEVFLPWLRFFLPWLGVFYPD